MKNLIFDRAKIVSIILSVAFLVLLICFCCVPLHKGKYTGTVPVQGYSDTNMVYEFAKHTVMRTDNNETKLFRFYFITGNTIVLCNENTSDRTELERLNSFSFTRNNVKFTNKLAVFELICIIIALFISLSITVYLFISRRYKIKDVAPSTGA
jgi:hypothetical protein